MDTKRLLKLLAILAVDALLLGFSYNANRKNPEVVGNQSPQAVSVRYHKKSDGSLEEHDFIRNFFFQGSEGHTDEEREYFCRVCGFSFVSGKDEAELHSISSFLFQYNRTGSPRLYACAKKRIRWFYHGK